MMMEILVKKIRDVVDDADGYRIFVDRYWPRGISKGQFKVDYWAKFLGPSVPLMKWFHEDRDGRFSEFVKQYNDELMKNLDVPFFIRQIKDKPIVTLVTDVHDPTHSHVLPLKMFLERQLQDVYEQKAEES